MPLGLAKDSMINLAEMAHKKDNDNDDSGLDGMGVDADEQTELSEHSQRIDDGLGAIAKDSLAMHATIQRSTERLDSSDSFATDYRDNSSAHGASVDPTKPSNSASAHGSAATASATSQPSSSYGQYSGFSGDYSEFEHYGNYQISYTNYSGESAIPTLLGGRSRKPGASSIWCCVFPWMNGSQPEEKWNEESEVIVKNGSDTPSRSLSKDDDESTGSEYLGDKLSEKEQKAVLARLRLAQPDESIGSAATEPSSDNQAEKDILKGIVTKNSEPKGILKHHSSVKSIAHQDSFSSQKGGDGKKRRSLFPQYENVQKPKKNLSCSFAPMARMVTVKSKNDMTEDEKSDIWWQKSDYEEFRRTGRMITKAMLEGGSEVWLASNQSWRLPNHNRSAVLQQAYSLSERQRAVKNGDIDLKKQHEATRDKWWHTFGHSRRGLEHVASIDEGRQRQENVRTAIRAVVEEQRRQRVFHREDPEKLRMVSIQNSLWARDLALAAGASDADAVKANFDEETRKSREFYLLKLSRTSNATSSKQKKSNIPAFMRPALNIPSTNVDPSRLDANTVSQIRYRRSLSKKMPGPPKPAQRPASEPEKETPIRDDGSSNPAPKGSMAKRAAGFASGEEAVNMSAVLTGMGAVPKQGTVGAS